MADIFISYAHENRAGAESLCLALRGEGYRVWWDYDLYAGEDFRDGIDEVLTGALAVIAIWSPAASRSPWVRKEVDHAVTQNKLVATYLAPFSETIIPEDLRQVHAVDVTAIDEIVRSLDRRGVTPRNKRPLPTASQYFALGLEFRRQYELAHAYSQFSKSIALNPNAAGLAYYHRSQTHDPSDAASIRCAIKDIECSIAIGGREADNYRQLGLCLYKAKLLEPAIQALSESIRSDPDSQSSFLYRARAYCSLDKRELALADYLRSLELDPECFETCWELAELYEALGDYEAAAQHYVDKETFRPKTALGLIRLAKFLHEISDHRIALECLADAAVLAPKDPRPRLLSAVIRGDLGDYQRAESDAAVAVSLHPFDPCGYRIRAELSMHNEHYDNAVRDLTRAMELSFENSIDYDKRATAYSYARDERASWNDAARANAIRREERRLGLTPDPPIL